MLIKEDFLINLEMFILSDLVALLFIFFLIKKCNGWFFRFTSRDHYSCFIYGYSYYVFYSFYSSSSSSIFSSSCFYSIISSCSYSSAASSSSIKRVGSYVKSYLPVLICPPFCLIFFSSSTFFFFFSAYFLILRSSFHFIKT